MSLTPSLFLAHCRRTLTHRPLLLAVALLLGLSGMAQAQVAQQYWECRVPSAGVEAGWCPVSTAYPPPFNAATGTISVLIATPLAVTVATLPNVNLGTSPLPVTVATALPAGTNVLGLVGGLEFNLGQRPTVQAAQYTAGEALGGLMTIPVGSASGITGILDQISVAFQGGSTAGQIVYVWDVNPTNTKCLDRQNFVQSGTDNMHLVTGTPLSLVPALVASAQDTVTYASIGNLTSNFVNGSGNGNLYACDLMNTTATPASATDFRFQAQGIKDQQ